MDRTPNDNETRRDFLSYIGRYSLLAVILGGAAALITRPRRGGPGAGSCSQCPALSRCGRLRARDARKSSGMKTASGNEPLCGDFSPGSDEDGSR